VKSYITALPEKDNRGNIGLPKFVIAEFEKSSSSAGHSGRG
jgi:hypothetical protein